MIKKIFILGMFLFFFHLNAFWKSDFYRDYENYEKVIRVNTYANKLSYYENWKKIGEISTSVWNYKNYTPIGRFRITNKSKNMYSQTAGKFMPYWMDFRKGKYWIHSFPENKKWDLDSNSRIWVSWAGWCVRLKKQKAKKLYERADIGTTVLIDYDKQQYSNPKKDRQVIKNYFFYINNNKYSKAFELKINSGCWLENFKKIYQNLKIKIQKIRKIYGSDFEVSSNIYYNNILIKRVTSVFQISDWKIKKSYIK